MSYSETTKNTEMSLKSVLLKLMAIENPDKQSDEWHRNFVKQLHTQLREKMVDDVTKELKKDVIAKFSQVTQPSLFTTTASGNSARSKRCNNKSKHLSFGTLNTNSNGTSNAFSYPLVRTDNGFPLRGLN